MTGADLSEAKLIKTDLSRATLSGADISKAEFRAAKLVGTDFQSTINGWTIFCDVDLAEAEGLARTEHRGPSYISTETLATSRGQIPDSFLHGSGLAPWERLSARLYDPSLTPHEITEFQYRIFDERTHGPMFVGGIFVSYSWKDVTFINKLHSRLEETNARVWLDRHDAVAGPLQKQVYGAIRLNDIVILVLSKDSIRSDWVENELEMARRKEKEEERDVLCPIALDDSWKSKMEIDEPNRALWLTLRQKLVLDFSKWKTKVFKPTFEKLVRGLKMYYPPAGRTSPQPPAGEI